MGICQPRKRDQHGCHSQVSGDRLPSHRSTNKSWECQVLRIQSSFQVRSPDVRDLGKTEQQRRGLTNATLWWTPESSCRDLVPYCPSRHPDRNPSAPLFLADSFPRRMSGKAQDSPPDILLWMVGVASKLSHSQFPDTNTGHQTPNGDSDGASHRGQSRHLQGTPSDERNTDCHPIQCPWTKGSS